MPLKLPYEDNLVGTYRLAAPSKTGFVRAAAGKSRWSASILGRSNMAMYGLSGCSVA
jgi:hypothetical protein